MSFQKKIEHFAQYRKNSEPLPTGIAPNTSSSLYKLPHKERASRPRAKCWQKFFSTESCNHHASTLKAAFSGPSANKMIPLGTARPSAEYYPWESVKLQGYNLPSSTSIGESEPSVWQKSVKGDSNFDLAVALNYGHAAGSPQVLRFVTEHMELVHDPPYDDWTSCLTSGTTSAIDIVLRIFCDPGDWILTEIFTYTGAIEFAKNLGLNIFGIEMDGEGLLPSDLDAKLDAWDPAKGRKPSVLYMIPTGQNPTGTTQSEERRRSIYAIAERHSLLIIEDDPYYFLQLGEEYVLNGEGTKHSQVNQYIKSLPLSYLSLDLSGRVIRLDSTSKILAPGLRCGWLTACSQIVDKVQDYIEFSTVSPSGPSQLMIYKLLDETWGHEGFFLWLIHLSAEYRRRRDITVAACQKHLPSDVCQWHIPTFGMFIWISIDCSKLPSSNRWGQQRVAAIEDEIHTTAEYYGVQISKGSWFTADNQHISNLISFRITFAVAPENTLEGGLEKFGMAVRKACGLM